MQNPRHIAVVMDGNGRWAKKRHLPRIAGHKSGVNATRKMVQNCVRLNIEALTVFAFSSENWKRPKSEVSGLMSLFVSTLASEVKKLHKQDIKVQFIGDRNHFSQKLQAAIKKSETLTESNTGLVLTIAVDYGGRWDILNAARQLFIQLQHGEITADTISEEWFASRLTMAELPEPDLFIRTGGECRISNFLLWQLAYTELYFSDILWPDFDDDEFQCAIDWYQTRQRRFGKITEQLTKMNHDEIDHDGADEVNNLLPQPDSERESV